MSGCFEDMELGSQQRRIGISSKKNIFKNRFAHVCVLLSGLRRFKFGHIDFYLGQLHSMTFDFDQKVGFSLYSSSFSQKLSSSHAWIVE